MEGCDESLSASEASEVGRNLSGWAARLCGAARQRVAEEQRACQRDWRVEEARTGGDRGGRNAPALLALLHLARLLVPLELLVVEHVVDAEGAVEDGGAVEVVDGEDGRALVGVHEPRELSGLARLRVARHVDVDDLAVPVIARGQR